jgi:hypothetical protein
VILPSGGRTMPPNVARALQSRFLGVLAAKKKAEAKHQSKAASKPKKTAKAAQWVSLDWVIHCAPNRPGNRCSHAHHRLSTR